MIEISIAELLKDLSSMSDMTGGQGGYELRPEAAEAKPPALSCDERFIK